MIALSFFINSYRKGKNMSGSLPLLARQMQKQIIKTGITKSTGLDDFLGIKTLNENEDIVIKMKILL